MKNYYFIFDFFGYIITVLLSVFASLSIFFILKKYISKLKIIAIYLVLCFFFDILSIFLNALIEKKLLVNSYFLILFFRSLESIIISYFIYQNILKYKIIWFFTGIGILWFIYELFTYQNNGVLNFISYAQIYMGIMLSIYCILGLFEQLQSSQKINITEQLLLFIFLSYFALYLVYTIVQNFILNQSFSNKSFVLFYSSYALLHIVYYSVLTYVLWMHGKKKILNSN